MKFQNIKVVKGKNDSEIKNAGLKSHGLVGKSSSGKVVSAVEGHLYGKKKVEKVMKEALAGN